MADQTDRPDASTQPKAVAARFTTDKDYASALRRAFAEAGYVLSVEQRQPRPLPATAPKLWADRTPDDPKSPSAFIRKVYAEWLPHSLARQDLYPLDKQLYFAYASWIRPGRGHETDTVEFAPKHFRSDRLDDVERGRRAHASSMAYMARSNNFGEPRNE